MAFTKEDAMRYLMSKGMSRVAAAGIVGTMGAESGYDPGIEEQAPNLHVAKSASEGGGYGARGLGLFQWTGPRRDALIQYAADHGTSPADPYLQMDFLVHELNTSEKRAGEMLASATNAEEATAGVLAAGRPAGWTPNGDVRLSSQYDTRLKNTRALLGDTAGDDTAPPVDTAQTDTPAPAPAQNVAVAQPQQATYGDAIKRLTSLLDLDEPSQQPASRPYAPASADMPTAEPMGRPARTPITPTSQQAGPALKQSQPVRPALDVAAIKRQLAALGGIWS